MPSSPATVASAESPSAVVRIDTKLRFALKADAAYRQISMRAHLDDIVREWLAAHGTPHIQALLRQGVP